MNKSNVTNGMQNIVMSRSDTARLRVDKFDLFLRFVEQRMATRIGMFPSKDIAATENIETTMKVRTPLENTHVADPQSPCND